MRTNTLITTALLTATMAGGNAFAQTGAPNGAPQEGPGKATMTHTPAIGITLGTSGLGLQGIYPLNRDFSLRGGVSFIPSFTYTRTDRIGETNLKQDFKTGFVNIHVLADYYFPVLRQAGFRLTGGFAWFVKAKSDVTSVPVGNYYYGDIQINDERMGDIRTTVTRDGIAPYLGAGFLNLYSNKHINVSLDLGTYYLLPEASVKMEATGYLTGNERNQEQLKENLKNYRWLPVAQLGVYYKF